MPGRVWDLPKYWITIFHESTSILYVSNWYSLQNYPRMLYISILGTFQSKDLKQSFKQVFTMIRLDVYKRVLPLSNTLRALPFPKSYIMSIYYGQVLQDGGAGVLYSEHFSEDYTRIGSCSTKIVLR